MELKDKQALEFNIKEAISNYIYEYNEDYFSCIARMKISKKDIDVKLLEPDDCVDDIVLLAIQEYFNTDNPKAWAEHNKTAYEIAVMCAQLAQIIKPQNTHKKQKR